MQVRLIVEAGKKRQSLVLQRVVSIIGRAKGCAVRIPSAEVSRRHCRLVQQDGYVVLEDLQSANGTFLNGQRLTNAKPVRPGDKVDVGPLRFVVGYQLTPAALTRLESFGEGVELVPEDSGPDFLEDSVHEEVAEVELIDDPEAEATPEMAGTDKVELIIEEEEAPEVKERVLADDDVLELPADLQLSDLLESPKAKEEGKKKA